MSKKRFRILSIDGGGIKGVFPASFLATLEEHANEPIGSYFDLIAGTSTGGIIAIGLSVGLSAKEILYFYESEGPLIFPNVNSLKSRIRHWFRPKYDPLTLRRALERVFGDKKVSDCKTRLLVPSLNAVTGDIHIIKTPHHPKLVTDEKSSLADVALATTAAPTYFPPHMSSADLPMIDGGIWANNPTGLAVVEAVATLAIPRDQIEVLSLGCTESPCNFEIEKAGKLGWAAKAIEAAMCGQSFASLGTAALLIGHDHLHRISPPVPPALFSLDSANRIKSLKGLGYHEARKALPTAMETFLDATGATF